MPYKGTRAVGQSSDLFEVVFHELLPSSFLQCYCECWLNEQKDKVGGWSANELREDSITLNAFSIVVLTPSVWFMIFWFDVNWCSSILFQFAIISFEAIMNFEVEKGFERIGQDPKV